MRKSTIEWTCRFIISRSCQSAIDCIYRLAVSIRNLELWRHFSLQSPVDTFRSELQRMIEVNPRLTGAKCQRIHHSNNILINHTYQRHVSLWCLRLRYRWSYSSSPLFDSLGTSFTNQCSFFFHFYSLRFDLFDISVPQIGKLLQKHSDKRNECPVKEAPKRTNAGHF